MADNRIWLDVAFAEKDEAKRKELDGTRQQGAGTRLDPACQRWIAGRHGLMYLICFPAKIATSVLACLLTSYRVAAGSATCALALISATGSACAG